MSPWRQTNNKVKTVLVSLLTKDCVKADFRNVSSAEDLIQATSIYVHKSAFFLDIKSLLLLFQNFDGNALLVVFDCKSGAMSAVVIYVLSWGKFVVNLRTFRV